MYNLYNKVGITDMQEEWKALERIKSQVWKEAFKKGREAGFAAGYAAASERPSARIEEAYQQGVAAASKLVLLRKNGVGY